MRFHRFFIKDKINPDEKVVLRSFHYESILSQWKKVFRYTTGSRVILFDGSGNDYLSIIEKIDGGEAVLRVLETNESQEDVPVEKGDLKKKKTAVSLPKITILMSLIKNDNFDLVLQKSTELGVSQIVPIITERTIKKDLNIARSQRILVEASEQCGRKDVPVLEPVKRLSDAISLIEGNKDKKIGVFVCNQNGIDVKNIISKRASYTDLVFFVGPEGGWSPKEIKIFEDKKIKFVKINNNVLRAETAAIALLAVVLQ